MEGLISRNFQVSQSYLEAIESEMKCTICLEVYKDPIETNCGHYFCKECFMNYLKANSKMKCNCPLCKTPVSKREFHDAGKLATITMLFQNMMDQALIVETYDRKGRGLSQSINGHQTKKRKFHQISSDKEVVKMQNFQYISRTENTLVTSSTANSMNMVTTNEPEEPLGHTATSMQSKLMFTKEEEVHIEEPKEKTPTRLPLQLTSKADLLETVKASRIQRKESANDCLSEAKSSANKDEKRILNIITSNLPNSLTDDVEKFCRLFKGRHHKDFTENVTHIIVYPSQDRNGTIQAKRTLKYLHGLIQGCWIVSYRWILDSIVQNEILNEESYEVTGDGYGIGAPKHCRLQGGLGSLFNGISILLEEVNSHDLAMKKAELIKLFTRAGGNVLKSPPKSTKNVFIIQILGVEENSQDYSKRKPATKKVNFNNTCLSHRWILDTLSTYELLEPSIYLV